MDEEELRDIVDRYQNALEKELALKRDRAKLEGQMEATKTAVLLEAIDVGLIAGKNAEARKLQTAGVLAEDININGILRETAAVQVSIDDAYSMRVSLEAEIGLTKAWLYSQARVG